jgi:hypothetical protein
MRDAACASELIGCRTAAGAFLWILALLKEQTHAHFTLKKTGFFAPVLTLSRPSELLSISLAQTKIFKGSKRCARALLGGTQASLSAPALCH